MAEVAILQQLITGKKVRLRLLPRAPLARDGGCMSLIIVGRPGGPDFLASEVEHLGNMGIIIGSILKV